MSKHIFSAVFLISSFLLSPQSLNAEDKYGDHTFALDATSSNGKFTIWRMPTTPLEATFTLNYQGDNMVANNVNPLTMDVTADSMDLSKQQDILEAKQADSSKIWNFSWSYAWKTGIRGGHQAPNTVYSLPFQRGVKCQVGQAFFGKLTHFRGSQEEYAVDLIAPKGVIICAAREGKVISVRSDSNIGGNSKSYDRAANYVVIKHPDGTYGNYVHMMYNSAFVKPGQMVTRGQAIGRVGNTGHVTVPHLHFDVSVPIDGNRRETLPIVLQTAEGKISNPTEAAFYTAI